LDRLEIVNVSFHYIFIQISRVLIMSDNHKPTFIDFFAGAGGFSRGFVDAGFVPVAAFDNDPRAVETLTGNFSDIGMNCQLRDLEKLSPAECRKVIQPKVFDQVDIVIGSPPCLGFSTAGRAKRKNLKSGLGRVQSGSNSESNNLGKTFLKFVNKIKPPVFIFENVEAMGSYDGGAFLKEVLEQISDSNYEPYSLVLNAVDYGVPQNRNRIFVAGVRKDISVDLTFPAKLTGKKKLTVREAIGDLPVITNGACQSVIEYKPKRISAYSKRMRKNMGGASRNLVFDHVTRNQNDQDIEAFSTLPEGGRYVDLKKKYKRYRDDIFLDKYKKLFWNKPSWTVTAHLEHDCYSHIHPGKKHPRTISIREAARLQSFPDNHFFSGNIGDRFRQIGNAVPPLLAETIARKLKKTFF